MEVLLKIVHILIALHVHPVLHFLLHLLPLPPRCLGGLRIYQQWSHQVRALRRLGRQVVARRLHVPRLLTIMLRIDLQLVARDILHIQFPVRRSIAASASIRLKMQRHRQTFHPTRAHCLLLTRTRATNLLVLETPDNAESVEEKKSAEGKRRLVQRILPNGHAIADHRRRVREGLTFIFSLLVPMSPQRLYLHLMAWSMNRPSRSRHQVIPLLELVPMIFYLRLSSRLWLVTCLPFSLSVLGPAPSFPIRHLSTRVLRLSSPTMAALSQANRLSFPVIRHPHSAITHLSFLV